MMKNMTKNVAKGTDDKEKAVKFPNSSARERREQKRCQQCGKMDCVPKKIIWLGPKVEWRAYSCVSWPQYCASDCYACSAGYSQSSGRKATRNLRSKGRRNSIRSKPGPLMTSP